MNKQYKDSIVLENSKSKKKGLFILLIRWFVVIAILLYYFLDINDRTSIYLGFFILFLILVLYTLVVSYVTIKARGIKLIKTKIFIVLDAIILSIFSSLLGGVNSEIYIFYFFILAYCSLYNDSSYTKKIGILCIAVYSLACIYSAGINISIHNVNFAKLMLRDCYILIASYGVMMINSEVKRFDELHRKEFKLARTDKLTGLANRRYFDQKLAEDVEYSNRTGNPLNILIFDLDNFKKFNDTYGHSWGDKLLTLFSDIIKQNIRQSDVPVRYGGEEFLIIIRDLDYEKAISVGERIRFKLEKQSIYISSDETRKRATVSCGVSQYPTDSKSIWEVIDFADKALYRAKGTTKNVVMSYKEI